MTSVLLEPAETLADDFAQQTVFHDETQALNPARHNSHGSTSTLLLNDDDDDYDDDYDSDNNHNRPPHASSKLKPEFWTLPPSAQPSYNTLFLGLAIYVAGLFASVPSLMDALVYMVCRHDFVSNKDAAHFNDPRCQAPDISAAVGLFQSYQTMISAIVGTVTIPILSSLSDRIGRKPLILWTVSCSLFSLVITIACTSLAISYKYILLGAAIEGLGGSTTMMSILCSSYISDCVREKHRAPILSVSEAIFYGSMALGPFIGSLFLALLGPRILLLFVLSALAQVFFLVLVYWKLPESRSARERRNSVTHFNNARRRKSSVSVHFREVDPTLVSSGASTAAWEALVAVKDSLVLPLQALALPHIPRTQPRTRLNVYILLTTSSILIEVVMCIMPILFLYTKTVFGWTSVQNGYFVSIIGVAKFVGLAVVFPPVLRYLRAHYDHSATRVDRADKLLLRCGIFILSGLYLGLAEAPTGGVFLGLGAFFMLSSINSPVLRNGLIKHAERGRVGELLGLSQFISRVISVVMPVMLASVYNLSVERRPQLVMEVLSGLVMMVFVSINFMSVEKEGEGDGV